MRLHTLEITAFGPFADKVTVDFDELSQAGVFLLAGPTGAGKTSVLDAVCFALYGEVPGERRVARHLRSDHAPPDMAPKVMLEMSVGPRTFRFTRSPAWTRAKRRGTGQIRVQAHVVVEERAQGAWSPLTNRLDDAGLLVTELLGMTCAQFTQVAMLPQGHFQEFLRASSAERHAVLQQLFRTHRFEDLERWLVDRRVELRRDSQRAQERTVAVLSRLQEAAGVVVPPQWELSDLAVPAGAGEVSRWAERLSADAQAAYDEAEQRQATAESVGESAQHEHGRLGKLYEARDRGTQARAVLTELAATMGRHHQLRQAVHGHRQAAPLLPLVRRADQATAAAAQTERQLGRRLAETADRIGSAVADLDEQSLADAEGGAAVARALAESFLPKQSRLAEATDSASAAMSRLAEVEAELVVLAAEAELLPEQVDGLRAERGRVAAHTTQGAPAELRVRECADGLSAAERVVDLTTRLETSQNDLRDAVELAQELRESYHQVRETRINGMAAELARSLVSGCLCPVCGSVEHPALATGSSHVGRSEEDEARRAFEAADFARQGLAEIVTTHQSELTFARTAAAETSVEQWQLRLDEANQTLADVRAAQERLTSMDSEIARLVERRERTRVATARAQLTRAEEQASLRECRATVTSLSDELAGLLAQSSRAGTIEELVAEHTGTAHAVAATLKTWRADERARDAAAAATETAQEAVTAAGFESAGRARAAMLSSERLTSHDAELAERHDQEIHAHAVLAEEAVAAAMEAPAEDVAGVLDLATKALASANQERDRARLAAAETTVRRDRVRALRGELEVELTAWTPVREAHELAAGLSAFAEGKGPDNPQRVRLSAYVLAERLCQVVAAANERLAKMTGERYSLDHTDDRGAGEQRGGLSLLVRDDWNGTRRDPATLSGGETFIVSLALALGLADTVCHEAGGTDIDTLFIDEGFGSLDSDTLEDVMDTLDALRDGGRVVGLVSHVAELRSRITTQLEVTKSRTGSTVRPVLSTR
ncbi:MAG: SMC family ATPase [Actinomycetota bacterium]|nr:SMC family ATPase [Actinomycetota bacterium]